MPKSIITIVGARPQFVKAAAVSRIIKADGHFEEKILHTGQHFDESMSAIFFSEMAIPSPHFHLHVHSLPHGAMTGRMLEGIEEHLLEEKPDAVMVYGDTNSTLAGALAAAKLHIPLFHVEAGLRSFNREMPEEINRILTDRISDLLFCPTQTAWDNLLSEGFGAMPCQMVLSGDVMQDAALFYAERAAEMPSYPASLGLDGTPFALATFHRQENTDTPENLNGIIQALNQLNQQIPVLAPLHPRTRKILDAANLRTEFQTSAPVGYLQMIQLLRTCSLVLTDSGGLQKEASFFGKYCVTLREETEWVELVEGGCNTLTGANPARILSASRHALSHPFPAIPAYYGGGQAAENIHAAICRFFGI